MKTTLTQNDCGCWIDNSSGVYNQREFAERILAECEALEVISEENAAKYQAELDSEDCDVQAACEIQDELVSILNDAILDNPNLCWEIEDNSLFLNWYASEE